MPRQWRIEYPGALFHGMSRGNRREDIFHDDVDRQDFIKTLAEACQKTGFQVHAFCLMRNHFHLVVENPNGNLVEGMRWLSGTEEQERSGETGVGGPAASGNDADDQSDRQSAAFG